MRSRKIVARPPICAGIVIIDYIRWPVSRNWRRRRVLAVRGTGPLKAIAARHRRLFREFKLTSIAVDGIAEDDCRKVQEWAIRGTGRRLLRHRPWQRYACDGVMLGVRVVAVVNVEGRSV
jgi:hypothetical protein